MKSVWFYRSWREAVLLQLFYYVDKGNFLHLCLLKIRILNSKFKFFVTLMFKLLFPFRSTLFICWKIFSLKVHFSLHSNQRIVKIVCSIKCYQFEMNSLFYVNWGYPEGGYYYFRWNKIWRLFKYFTFLLYYFHYPITVR